MYLYKTILLLFFSLFFKTIYAVEFIDLNTPDGKIIKLALPKDFCVAPKENSNNMKNYLNSLYKTAQLTSNIEIILNECELKSNYPWGYITINKELYFDDYTQEDLNTLLAPTYQEGLSKESIDNIKNAHEKNETVVKDQNFGKPQVIVANDNAFIASMPITGNLEGNSEEIKEISISAHIRYKKYVISYHLYDLNDKFSTLKIATSLNDSIKETRLGYDKVMAKLSHKNKQSLEIEDNKALNFGNYHALIIANNDYEYLPKLDNAINDAYAIAALLEKKFKFQSTVIENATRNQILAAIYELRKINENDNIIIYYSGHGFIDSNAETAYWQPIDAQKNKPYSWIHESELKSELRAISAKHVMILADSCFSGAILRGIEEMDIKNISKEIIISRNLKKRIRVAFTSGGEEPVLDGGGGKNSIFAKSLLEVLEEINEPVEGRYVFNRVSEKIVLNAKQQPQYDPIYNAGGERGGDFIFVPINN